MGKFKTGAGKFGDKAKKIKSLENHLLTKPVSKPSKFIGREKELSDIEKLLKSNKTPLILSGADGMGKTELAKQYFHNNFDKYKHLAWINYTNDFRESLVNEIAETRLGLKFGDKDDTEKRFEKLLSAIARLKGDTLFVIDNFDNPEDRYLNDFAGLHVDVIIISGNKTEGFGSYKIRKLRTEECIKLFCKHYITACDKTIVENIVKTAGYHTLMIEFLAKTARAYGTELEDFYGLLKEKGFNLNETEEEKTGILWHGEKNRKCFFDNLKLVFHLSNLKDEEKNLLVNLSLMPSVPIEKSKLKKWLELSTLDSLKGLAEKGWIKEVTYNGKACAEMHGILREFMRWIIEPEYGKISKLVDFMSLSLKCKAGENRLSKNEFVKYAVSILKYCGDENEEIAALSNNLSLFYKAAGDLPKALEYSTKALEILEKVSDEAHPNLAAAYNNTGLIHKDMGALPKALECSLKALVISAKAFGENHPHLAEFYNSVEQIYEEMGDYKNALEYSKKGLAIKEKTLDENHPDLAASYNNIGLICKDIGDLKNALEYSKKGLAIREKILDKNHPDLATSYDNLGLIYQDMGDLKNALEYSEKGLEIREKVLDKNHPHLAFSYDNIGTIYQDMGDLPKALEYSMKALEIFEKVLDENHPDLAATYNNIGRIYQDMGNLHKVSEYLKKALKIYEKILDMNHPFLATAYNNIGIVCQDVGDLPEALEYLMKALEIYEKVLDKNHPYLTVSYNNIGLIYQVMGELPEALEYYEKALKIREQSLDKNHPDLATSYNNIGVIHFKQNDYAASTKYFEKAVNILKHNFPDGHPSLFASMHWLVLSRIASRKS